jgi:hypothetical protein
MLLKKAAAPGDIMCFKITTGEEIVGKLVEETEKGFVLSKPCTVIPSQQGLGLMQSLMCADINIDVTLNKKTVIMSGPVIKDIENHYIRTTTGIETAPASGIIKSSIQCVCRRPACSSYWCNNNASR